MRATQCEDQRPCARCITRSEECIHMNRGPKLVKLRCECCRKDNKKCEDTRPCKHCIEQNVECVNATRKGRGHGTRVMAVSQHFHASFPHLTEPRLARTAGEIRFDVTEIGTLHILLPIWTPINPHKPGLAQRARAKTMNVKTERAELAGTRAWNLAAHIVITKVAAHPNPMVCTPFPPISSILRFPVSRIHSPARASIRGHERPRWTARWTGRDAPPAPPTDGIPAIWLLLPATRPAPQFSSATPAASAPAPLSPASPAAATSTPAAAPSSSGVRRPGPEPSPTTVAAASAYALRAAPGAVWVLSRHRPEA